MAFTGNIRQPNQYTGQRSGNSNQSSFDRLITVTGYDLDKGYVYGTDEKGRNLEVYINPEEVSRANAAVAKKGGNIDGYKFMGHSIDEKMKKYMPPKSKMVLIRSKIISNDKTRNVSVTEAHRIGSVPAPEEDKTFQGIFTLTPRPEDHTVRVGRVQHWNPNGIDINDDDALQKLKEQMDDACADYGTKVGEFNVTKPTMGIQFRTLVKTDREYAFGEEGKKEIYDAVDFSVPFDWIPGPLDEEGKEIKTEAHPITGSEMLDLCELYAKHIEEHPSFQGMLDNIKVEVCFYHVYPASKNENLLLIRGNDKDVNADKNPLYQLSHAESFVDMAQTEKIMGRNSAVTGIIQIGANRLEKVDGKPVEIPSYWVNKLHANNMRGHVHAFVRTSDGQKVMPVEALKIIRKNNPENDAAPADETPQREERVVNSRPVEPVKNTAPTVKEEEEFDPFANPESTPTPPADNPPAADDKKEVRTPRFGSRNKS